MSIWHIVIPSAGAVAASTIANQAGPCSPEIYSMEARIEARLNATRIARARVPLHFCLAENGNPNARTSGLPTRFVRMPVLLAGLTPSSASSATRGTGATARPGAVHRRRS